MAYSPTIVGTGTSLAGIFVGATEWLGATLILVGGAVAGFSTWWARNKESKKGAGQSED